MDEVLKNEEKILKALEGTSLGGELAAVLKLKDMLDEKQKLFCRAFDMKCPEGCGSCCEHFMPDVTPMESDDLALGIIAMGRAEEAFSKIDAYRPGDKCFFYNPDNPYHCTVYRWRPLVCRLFGASASENKEGRPAFKRCKWNPGSPEPSSAELEAKPDALVLMGEYGLMLDECGTGNTERLLIPEALGRSIDKIKFMLDLII
ncbi:MAG: YkgJ family cysteine cluster protein, partial [Clostridia bacterium]|nr:YkgJ family cysteine cluster protein [Clostridia bacterium]